MRRQYEKSSGALAWGIPKVFSLHSPKKRTPVAVEPPEFFLFEIYQGLVIDLTEVSPIHGREIHVEGFFTRVERTGEVDRVNRKILEVCR